MREFFAGLYKRLCYAGRSARLAAGLAAALLVLAGGLPLPPVPGTPFGGAGEAYANAPVPRYNFEIYIKNAPEGVKGLDFLVPEEKIPADEYMECNEEALEEAGLPADCELVTYKEEGAVSFSAHDRLGELDTSPVEMKDSLAFMWHESGYDLVTKLDAETRIVLFDGDGSVLACSLPFKAYASRPREFLGLLEYDVSTGEVNSGGFPGGINPGGGPEPDKGSDGLLFTILLLVLILSLMALATMVLELLIGLLFRLKPVWWVIPVNLVSNLFFNLLLIIFCAFFGVDYYVYIAVGEIAVIAAEFGVYRLIYKELSSRRLLLYSITANLVSAAAVFFFVSSV